MIDRSNRGGVGGCGVYALLGFCPLFFFFFPLGHALLELWSMMEGLEASGGGTS